MINFALKTNRGKEVLGIAIDKADIEVLQNGGKLVFDLDSVQVGFWRKELDGSRKFMQPRDSQVLILSADSTEQIGEAIGLELPSMEEIRRLRDEASTD